MTPLTTKLVRRSLCVALGSAALAAAGAAGAQSYYPGETTTTYGPVTTYGPGYESTTTTTTTYGPAPAPAWPDDEAVTSAPYEPSASATYVPPTAYAEPGITVYGHPFRPGDHDELSERVSYADLDLTTKAGADALKWRVEQTARSLCRQLGERPEREQNTSVLPSCQAAARDSASAQVSQAIDSARYWASR